MFLILTIIIVLIWLIPKFFLYKKSKQHEEIKEKSEIVFIDSSTMNKVEEAGIKHFNETNIPTKENEKKKVTLKELQNEKIVGTVKNGNVICNVKNTYVEITKNANDYALKTFVKCSSETKQRILYLNNYSYCDGSYLCEFNEQKEKEIKEKEEQQKNLPVPDTGVNDGETKELTAFGPWKNYKKTSCDKKEIKCDVNNTNCLREVKVEVKKEVVGEKPSTYYTSHTALRKISTKTQLVCSDYNYLVINNNIYRTEGNYEEIFSISKISTDSWTYRGEISTNNSPYFGDYEYYKFVGIDDNSNYKYDSYKFNYPTYLIKSLNESCSNKSYKNVNYYEIYKQQEVINKNEKIYENVCYSSERTREYK